MKERHEVKFGVSDAKKYNSFLAQRNSVTGELVHKSEIKDCGGHLESLVEVEPGVYQMSIIIDNQHPRMQELFNISSDRGFRIELKGIPVVTPLEVQDIAQKVLEEQAA